MFLSVFLFLGTLFSIIFIPFLVLQLMPGRNSLLLAVFVFLMFITYLFQSVQDYGDGRMGEGSFLAQGMLFSTFMGSIFRIFILGRKRKKAGTFQPFGSEGEWVVIGVFILLLVSLKIFCSTGICIHEGRKLTDDELISRNVSSHSGYYKIEKARPSMLGFYRVNVTSYLREEDFFSRHEYKMNSFKLDACGFRTSDIWRMSEPTEKVEEMVKKYGGFKEIK